MDNELGTIDNSRTGAQRAFMEKTVGQGVCPFCVLDRTLNIPMWEEAYDRWWVWRNPFGYPNHSHHFVIALRRHETDYCNLTPEEGLQKFLIEQRVIREFDLPGGGLAIRFGDPDYNAGTITHLHGHIQVPDREGFAIVVLCKDARLIALLGGK